jgi:DNA-binding PadR family transcriptional regulator
MNLDDMGKYKDPSMLILLSLSENDKHGYLIMEDIRNNFHIEFSPGTLYGTISRLEKNKLIKPIETDNRRVPYTITSTGIELLQRHIANMQKFVSVGSARLEQRQDK